jgi:hypothetical protein
MQLLPLLALAAAFTLPAACSDSSSAPLSGTGTLAVRLTDAPFSTDSVKSVDVFVVRVEGRVANTDDNDANANLDNGASSGWEVLASPNASFDLLALQNGATASLGQAPIGAGSYSGFRFIIDPSKSSVTLKNGLVLSNSSSPDVTFPSAARSGIKIVLSEPVKIVGGATTTLLVDFDVNSSFVQRGNSIQQNGLLFKPVIKGSIVDAATVNANVRLANASASSLSLLKSGTALAGSSDLAFGASSSCSSVNAATPALTVVQSGSTTPLPGFAPVLAVGGSYTFVGYPAIGGGVQFVTLSNAFTPAAGQAGFRVFNGIAGGTGLDVFVTASGASLTTATVSNVVGGANSAFVSVPAGASQVRLTATGLTTVLLDLGSQTFTAAQNATLIIAPPAVGSTELRAFLVNGC